MSAANFLSQMFEYLASQRPPQQQPAMAQAQAQQPSGVKSAGEGGLNSLQFTKVTPGSMFPPPTVTPGSGLATPFRTTPQPQPAGQTPPGPYAAMTPVPPPVSSGNSLHDMIEALLRGR
jgi:hypothetical protein